MKVSEIYNTIPELANGYNKLGDQELLNVDLNALYDVISKVLEVESEQGFDNFTLVIRTIIGRLFAIKSSLTDDEQFIIGFFQYLFCTEAAQYCSSNGVFTECHDWIVYSISDEWEYGDETNFQFDRITNFLLSDNIFIANNVLNTFLGWIEVLFYYSRRHGGLIEASKKVIQFASKVLTQLLQTNKWIVVSESAVVIATCQALAWSINYKQDPGEMLAETLAKHFDKSTNDDVKKTIGVQLSLSGSDFTTKNSTEWIILVFSNYDLKLTGLEKMILLGKWYSDDPDKLQRDWGQLIQAIDEYVKKLGEGNDLHIKYEKSRLFTAIAGVVRNGIEIGILEIVNTILSTFYNIPVEYRLKNSVLYLIGNYNYGVLYGSPSGIQKLIKDTPADIISLFEIANKFLSARLAINDFPDFVIHNPDNLGVPIPALGMQFEDALIKHYQFEKLENTIIQSVTCLAVIPGYQHPIQSLMLKYLQRTFPISASLEYPNKKRNVKRVLLWCFGTRTSDLELRLTKDIFQSKGVIVDAINILEVSKNDFANMYQSADYDLVWVGTHGNYDQLLPHLSSIDIHPDGYVRLSDLIGIAPSTDKQRMLFLNICDGATASTQSAMYDLGIGAALCNRNQAVLSHIWMVKIESSFVYGVLYAHYLVNPVCDFFTAYERVIQAMLKGKKFIKDLLTSYYELYPDLLYFIDQLDDDIHNNIYYWGSGVYYE